MDYNFGGVPNFQANKAYQDIYSANNQTYAPSMSAAPSAGGLPTNNQPAPSGMPAAGGMQFLPPALQTGYGIYQAIKGNRLASQNVRPTYTIPKEIDQNLSDAQRMAIQGMPEQQRQNYINDLQRNAQQSLNQMGSRQAGLAGLGVLNQNQNDAYAKLLGMDAQQRMANMQQLQQVRSQTADYRDKAFDLNQMQPYANRYAEAQAMQNAGNQNMMGGVQSTARMAGQAANLAMLLI